MRGAVASCGGGLLLAVSGLAQAAPRIDGAVVSDERRRGISWSDGRASAQAGLGLAAGDFRLDASATALRNSPRHRGADAGVDLSGGWRQREGGAVRVDAAVIAHLFAGGAGRLNYVELQAGGNALVGPVSVDLSVTYAPPQRSAIGGDNLYLAARARLAVIGTPFGVVAGVGRSSGHTDDPVAATRLRPGGTYYDWQLGVEHIRGPIGVSVSYVGNDIARRTVPDMAAARHAGDAVVARIALTL
ncbi:TorF family putative porin [Sphingomonas solaris]|uniref:Porin n=1 Tax=Alterirhizorhabdus solaris TaxID=2529389 RepID=A0A558QV88_9SPHN|nr:TorF family putative porin [Sphingomonas solaris]TVV71060.1 hypothetical protein FOY91_17670 [Sphingomonas solaris]